MNIPVHTETVKHNNVIPFAPPVSARLRRQAAGCVKSFAARKITRPLMNVLMAGFLPPHRMLDCGTYQVLLTFTSERDDAAPVVVFQTKTQSASGRCPVCGSPDYRYMAGAGKKIDVYCRECFVMYTTSGEVL